MRIIRVRCSGRPDERHRPTLLRVQFVYYPPDVDSPVGRWKFDRTPSLGGSPIRDGIRRWYDTPTADPRARKPRWVASARSRGYGLIPCPRCSLVAEIPAHKFQEICTKLREHGVSHVDLYALVVSLTRSK
jgi:hypothetical protein